MSKDELDRVIDAAQEDMNEGVSPEITVEVSIKDKIIDHPAHYKSGGIEAIDVIEAFKLNFNLGNVVKYTLRSGNKEGQEMTDLLKAQWYIDREIKRLKEERLKMREGYLPGSPTVGSQASKGPLGLD